MNISKTAIKLFFSVVLGSATCGMSIPANAHHGWTWYGDTPFTLTAEVVEKDFGNPHDRLILRDDKGQQWQVLLSPPGRSRRAGLDDEQVQVGDTVTAYGHRRSEGDNFEMKTERLKVGEKIFNLYPNRS